MPLAGRRANRDEKKPREQQQLDRSSLAGASLLTLRRLEVLDGGREAAARRLKAEFDRRPGGPLREYSESEIQKWFSRGVPKAVLGDPVKLAFLFTDLNALAARHDETAEKRRQRREKLAFTGLLDRTELEPGDDPRMASRATDADRVRARQRLERIGAELVAEAARFGKKRSAVSLLAEQLRVPPRTVKRWLADGKVSGVGIRRLSLYEREQKHVAAMDRAEKRVFEELMAAGRKPHVIKVRGERYYNKKKKKWVTPIIEKHMPVVPQFRGGQGQYGGDATSGYRWNIPIRKELSPAVLAEMVQKALAVPPSGIRKLPEWCIFAIVSVFYSKEGERGHPIRARSGSGKAYGDNVRPDLEAEFPDIANRFVVKDAYSSGNHATLKQAATEFERRMWKEIETEDRTFVHGVVVWTFRRRTIEELARIVEDRKERAEQDEARAQIVKKERTKKKLSAAGKRAVAEFEKRQKAKKE